MTTTATRNETTGLYDVFIDGEFVGTVGKQGCKTVPMKEVDKIIRNFIAKPICSRGDQPDE